MKGSEARGDAMLCVRYITALALAVHWAMKEHGRSPTGLLTWYSGLLKGCKKALYLGVAYKREKREDLVCLFSFHLVVFSGQGQSRLTPWRAYPALLGCRMAPFVLPGKTGSVSFDVECCLSSRAEGHLTQAGSNLEKERNRQWQESEKMHEVSDEIHCPKRDSDFFLLPPSVSWALPNETTPNQIAARMIWTKKSDHLFSCSNFLVVFNCM